MSLEGLQERFAALQETVSQLRDLISRLAALGLPQEPPSAVALDDSSTSDELGAEIVQILRGGLEEQELLHEEVKYLKPDGQEKSRLTEGIERTGKELVSCRYEFRKARISARKSLERAQRLQRTLLLQSLSSPVTVASSQALDESEWEPEHASPPVLHPPRQAQQQSSLSEEDRRNVGASSSVTSALRRTHDLIAAELSRSEFAQQTLTESSAALKQLNESYSSLDTMLASSKDLLGTLLRSQKSDTWYLQTALYMLLCTGAWLVFRRILYGPLWWLLWLPLRVLFGVGIKAGGAVMRRQDGPAGSAVETMIRVDGGLPVEGLPEDLPTVNVGQDDSDTGSGQETDSVVEEVKRLVEGGDEGRPKDEL